MRNVTTWLTSIVGIMGLMIPGIIFPEEPKAKDDDQIGEVFGKPVYRRDLKENANVGDQLRQLFLVPVLTRYQAEHKKEITPMKEEIDAATIIFDKQYKEKSDESEPETRAQLKEIEEQLKQPDLKEAKKQELLKDKKLFELSLELNKKVPGRRFAEFMLTSWKLQKHFYDKYGGGRILWQQGGTEAFDATHKWLEAREKAGDFIITDKDLRAKFYAYWTTQNHGAFLSDDPEQIKKFLEPAWAPKRAPAKKVDG